MDNPELYDQVAKDLAGQIRELLQRRSEIDNRINALRETLRHVLQVSDAEVLDYVLPELPSSISATCEAVIKYADKPMTPVDIRNYLEKIEFAPLKDYTNALATIHTTLKRMEKKGQVVTRDKDGKVGYVWNDARFTR